VARRSNGLRRARSRTAQLKIRHRIRAAPDMIGAGQEACMKKPYDDRSDLEKLQTH
jgi:hypothetical protein